MTHPFHPLSGRDFEFVVYRQNRGEDRVHLRDEDGQLFSLSAGWTDVAAPDPFVVIAGLAPQGERRTYLPRACRSLCKPVSAQGL